MALPPSGEIGIDDINVELGKAANAPLSTNDADFLALAGVVSGVESIPDDFYGKSAIDGELRASYSVVVQDFGGGLGWGFTQLVGTSSITPDTFMGEDINFLLSYNNTASHPVIFALIAAANLNQSDVTAIEFVEEGVVYDDIDSFGASGTWNFNPVNTQGPWDATDVGLTKTVKVYGKAPTQEITVTAAQNGFNVGYIKGSIGSINPTSSFTINGLTVEMRQCSTNSFSGVTLFFVLEGTNINATFSKSTISAIKIEGTAAADGFYRAENATYTETSAQAQWTWTLPSAIQSSDVFTVKIYEP